MAQQEQHFEALVKYELNYLLHLPRDYATDKGQSWPLIMSLHGMGERGSDLGMVKAHGLPKKLDHDPDFPFIVVSPQCPITSLWLLEIKSLKVLLDHILSSYAVDPDRVYLTGLSMGGYGTWTLGCLHPEMFAAIAPICGGGLPDLSAPMKDLPIWAFHGDADDVVPLSESLDMVEALKAIGGDVKLTIYPGVGHDSWTQTYNNPELYEWFLSHKRKSK